MAEYAPLPWEKDPDVLYTEEGFGDIYDWYDMMSDFNDY